MTDTPPAGKPSAFTLQDLAGESRSFPTGRPSLICFAKEDCATCNLVAPLLEAFHRTWGDHADVWMVAQARDGAEILRDRHGLTLPILDDSGLRTSLAWDFDTTASSPRPRAAPSAPVGSRSPPPTISTSSCSTRASATAFPWSRRRLSV